MSLKDGGAGGRDQSGAAKQKEWLLWIARIPVPLLLAAIVAARATGLRETYASPNLMLILSFIFYTLVSLGTLFLSDEGFWLQARRDCCSWSAV